MRKKKKEKWFDIVGVSVVVHYSKVGKFVNPEMIFET